MTLAARVGALATAIANYLRDSIVPRLVPGSGGAGQVLAKASATDYDLAWSDVPGGNKGTVTVTFGADRSMAATTVATTSILASSVVTLRANEAGTADHSADEHLVENYDLRVANVIPGTSFDVVMLARDKFGLTGQWSFKYQF